MKERNLQKELETSPNNRRIFAASALIEQRVGSSARRLPWQKTGLPTTRNSAYPKLPKSPLTKGHLPVDTTDHDAYLPFCFSLSV